MKIKRFNESVNNETPDQSVRELVKRILDDCKLDVDALEESDPEFIPYICDMITEWHNNNK